MPIVVLTSEQLQKLVRDVLEGRASQEQAESTHQIVTQAVLKDPRNFWLNFWLAGIKNRMGDLMGAVAMLERAYNLPGCRKASVLNNLGSVWRRVNVSSEARAAFEEALKLTPNDPDILNNLGTLHVNEGSPVEGEKVLRRAIEADPGRPHPHWNLSLCLLEQQKWAEGFTKYVWGLVTKDRPSKPYTDHRLTQAQRL